MNYPAALRASARALLGCGVVARQFEGAEKPAAGLLQARRNSHRTVQIWTPNHRRFTGIIDT